VRLKEVFVSIILIFESAIEYGKNAISHRWSSLVWNPHLIILKITQDLVLIFDSFKGIGK